MSNFCILGIQMEKYHLDLTYKMMLQVYKKGSSYLCEHLRL